jgi:hypothetical protein
MPTTGSGKILKTELRKRYLASRGEAKAPFSLSDCGDIWDTPCPEDPPPAEEGSADNSIMVVECHTENDFALAESLVSEYSMQYNALCYHSGKQVPNGALSAACFEMLTTVNQSGTNSGSTGAEHTSRKDTGVKDLVFSCIAQTIGLVDYQQSVWDAGMTSMLAVTVS